MKQNINKYTAEDQKVWSTLYNRQIENLQDKSCKEYLDCLHDMSSVLNSDIPDFQEINKWFETSTQWQIEVVSGLIPVEEFFSLLSQKKFCSSTWLRSWNQLDYLEEPDMFHDVFGHIPILSHPIFSEFAHELGKLGVKHIDNEAYLIHLQRLYWFTIEFGLYEQQDELSIYGAGIISSFGESNSSLADGVQVLPFDIDKVIHQEFKNDEPQKLYFKITKFEQLLKAIHHLKTQLV